MQLIIVFILIFIATGSYFYIHNKRSKALPQQIREVKKLVELLNRSKIEITFCIYDVDTGITKIERPVAVNFFGIAKFASKISFKDFEEDEVLFEAGSNQVFELKNFIKTSLLPKVILDEILDFSNTNYKVMEFEDNDRPKRFVTFKTGSWQENKDITITNGDELLKGDAIAFDSWVNFQEHVEQLEFVIMQWLRDTNIEENNIRIELN